MEKIILKTIREAFKIAYFNKLIKESTEDMAKKLTADQLRVAENNYNLWINGKKDISDLANRQGENIVLNYMIEKALEEYKQTKDSRLKDKISVLFYPEPKKKIWSRLKYTNHPYRDQIEKNLKLAFGDYWQDYFDDVAAEAWQQTLQEPGSFDEIANSYKGDRTEKGTGVGGLIFTKLATNMNSIASKYKAKKRGGGILSKGFGTADGGETDDAYASRLKGSADFQNPETMGSEDYGSDVSGSQELDIADDSDFAKNIDGQNVGNMIDELSPDKLRKTFADLREAIKNSNTNPIIKEVLVNFLGGITPSESFAKNTDFFMKSGKDVKQIKNEMNSWPTLYLGPPKGDRKGGKFYYLADDIGVQNGLPKGWLNFVSKYAKLIDIAKFLNTPNNLNESDEKAKFRSLFFKESTLNIDIDKVVQEVYKRLAQIK